MQPKEPANTTPGTKDAAADKPTVLIVEDMAVTREPLLRIMKDAGYEAIGAEHGADALDILATHEPHLILLDILMPVMNGIEFLTRLRERPQWRRIPVIVLTAIDDPIYRQEAHQLGAAGFLLKHNISIDDFLATVRQHIDPG